MPYAFETLDVFTTERFGGNPLAVFPEAQGLGDAEMQALAAEFNLSETTFVLPPADPTNTARVRIFNRVHEMPFAGHPSVGTAWVLARRGLARGGEVRMEVPAGIVRVRIEEDGTGNPVGGRITAPQPLRTGGVVDPAAVAACAGLARAAVITTLHAPIEASVGVEFLCAEIAGEALAGAVPDLAAFRAALQPWMNGRFSLFLYAREGAEIRARMFAPLAGTWEDPATGSASAALGALLHSLGAGSRFTIRQGVEMGRPSLIDVEAEAGEGGSIAHVGGRCVPMFRGELA